MIYKRKLERLSRWSLKGHKGPVPPHSLKLNSIPYKYTTKTAPLWLCILGEFLIPSTTFTKSRICGPMRKLYSYDAKQEGNYISNQLLNTLGDVLPNILNNHPRGHGERFLFHHCFTICISMTPYAWFTQNSTDFQTRKHNLGYFVETLFK